MTIAIQRPPAASTVAALPERIRCDICGALVIDPDMHLEVCVDHEVAMFAIGRRAG
jgi:hypothetical protein